MNNDNIVKEERPSEKNDCCVCVNIFAKCDKNQRNELNKNDCKSHKINEKCCVCINVFTECE